MTYPKPIHGGSPVPLSQRVAVERVAMAPEKLQLHLRAAEVRISSTVCCLVIVTRHALQTVSIRIRYLRFVFSNTANTGPCLVLVMQFSGGYIYTWICE